MTDRRLGWGLGAGVMAHSPRVVLVCLLSALLNCFFCWALNLGVGASRAGWQGLLFCLGHLIAVPPPSAPISTPQHGEAHLHSCEPVVSKAKLRVWSVLRHWDLRPLPAQPGARPMMYRTSDTWTSSSPQSPLFLQAARPCTVSSTTVTSVSVLCWVWGHKQALRVWGKAVL